MASISATGSKNHHTFTLEVWENSYSVDNNNSSVHYKLTAGASSFNFNWTSKSVTYTIDIGGNVGSISSGYYPKNSSWVVLEGDCNVGHEDDGSKTMGFSFSVSDGINQSYTTGNCSAWGQLTLTTIPRASQPSCVTWPYNTQNVGYLGDTITIHMNRKSSSFTHTVRYGWGDKSGVIGTGVTDNCRWTIPLNFAENIPDTTEGTGAIYVDTYNGASFVGTKSCQFTCYINSSTHKPSVGSVYYIQTNENTKNFFNGDNKVVVQNFSSLSVTFSGCSGFYGSTIKEYKVNCSGVIYTSTSPTVTVSGVTNNNSLECQVVDSRGITSNIKTLGFDFYYPYSAPSVSDLYLKRVNDIEDVVLFGFKSIFCETAILGDFGTLTIEYRYKKSGEQDYGSYITIPNSGAIQEVFDLTLEDKFDTESNYIFELSLRDYFSQYTTTLLLSTAQPELSIRKDMVGINCVPQRDKIAALQVNGYGFSKCLNTTIDTSVGIVSIARVGNVVSVCLDTNQAKLPSAIAWSSALLFTLPDGFKPISRALAPIWLDKNETNPSTDSVYFAWVYTDGNVYIITRSTAFTTYKTNYGAWLYASFITGDDWPSGY